MSISVRVKRVLVHAGLPKTATTSIQNACFAQRDALLREHGILYPGDTPNHTAALCTIFMQKPETHIANRIAGLTDADELRQRSAEWCDGLEAELRATQPETVLFSAEGLSNLSRTELAAFRQWLGGFAESVSVLYVVRNPVDYVASVIQQNLKAGAVLEDAFEKLPLPRFQRRLTSAIQAFGRENLSVRTFEEMISGPDGIVGGFLDWAGVTAGAARKRTLATRNFDNVSLSHEAALVLSSLNRQRPAFVDGRRGPQRTRNELGTIARIKGRKFRLPRHVAEAALEQTRPDVEWLQQNLGVTFDTPPSPAAGGASEPAPIPDATVDSLALIISDFINDRFARGRVDRARELARQGRYGEMQKLVDEVRRVDPERPLPEALMRRIDAGSASD